MLLEIRVRPPVPVFLTGAKFVPCQKWLSFLYGKRLLIFKKKGGGGVIGQN